jgi:hypothetical protein
MIHQCDDVRSWLTKYVDGSAQRLPLNNMEAIIRHDFDEGEATGFL